ncbi:MAG: PAS domain S-box protein [Desulfuromonadia bacterium]
MPVDPPQKSIRNEFFSRIVGVIVITTLLLGAAISLNEWANQKKLLRARGAQLARYVATLSVDPLVMNDMLALDAIVAEGKGDREILYIVVKDEEGRGVTSRHATLNYDSPHIQELLPEISGIDTLDGLLSLIASRGNLTVTAPIQTGDQWIGNVEVCLDQRQILSNILRTIGWIVLGNGVATLFLIAVLMVVSRRVIFEPLSRLVAGVDRLAAGDRQVKMDEFRRDEFGLLMEAFNGMVERIDERTVSKVFFQDILTSTRDAIVILSDDGRIVELNPAASRLLKSSRESLKGEPIDRFILNPPEPCGCCGDLSCSGVEMTITDPDGVDLDLLVSCSPLSHPGEGKTVMTFLDVSPLKRALRTIESMNESLRREIEQRTIAEEEARCLNEDLLRQTEALRQSNESLESFCYTISHDLRAPLRHINGFTTIIGEDYGDCLGEEGRELLRKVVEASNRMGGMIDDLLSFSRIARMDITCSTLDLSALARQVAAMYADMEPHRAVRVTVEEGMTVQGDPTMMRLVLQNLIDNGWKYTASTPDPVIEVGRREIDGETVYFVADNGAGFDMAYADKLFGVFQRLHGAEFEGSGIGLATVRKIIERHGGSVWGEGRPGEGSTFFFTLPG